MPSRARHLTEYVFARALLGLIDTLPFGVAAGLARGAADVWYVCDVRRRRIALSNIRAAGMAAGAHDARAVARASFRHFGMLMVETLKSAQGAGRTGGEIPIEWRIPPEVAALLDDPTAGIILASGHIGNWELAARVLSGRKPVLGVTRRMNNPYVERLVQRRKPAGRFHLTPKHDGDVGRFVGALKRGEILALMIDQHAQDRGMLIDFLGRPASTHTAIALLHLVTGAPLCFGYCLRTGPMRFAFHAVGPIRQARTGDKQRDVRAILERLTAELEKAIQAEPGQYLWAHRRWRTGERADHIS
ncbi:MAG: lysophospholipid acyltransferase family protein [Kiritimatiellae bacterium]|nr:lysophospholipid acyltransferase family protein [Kiritimatiellia bacterium]